MGFFSWNCKRCGHPMLSQYALDKNNGWMNDVVVLLEDGAVIKGEYDGYGRVVTDTGDEREIHGYGKDPECYHEHCWEKAGRPTNFKSESDYSDDQGYFFDDKVHNFSKSEIDAQVGE